LISRLTTKNHQFVLELLGRLIRRREQLDHVIALRELISLVLPISRKSFSNTDQTQ